VDAAIAWEHYGALIFADTDLRRIAAHHRRVVMWPTGRSVFLPYASPRPGGLLFLQRGGGRTTKFSSGAGWKDATKSRSAGPVCCNGWFGDVIPLESNPDPFVFLRLFPRVILFARLGVEKAAKEKRIDGATLEYMDMTMSCVECHKYARNVLVAK
jgi:hypothetical protein